MDRKRIRKQQKSESSVITDESSNLNVTDDATNNSYFSTICKYMCNSEDEQVHFNSMKTIPYMLFGSSLGTILASMLAWSLSSTFNISLNTNVKQNIGYSSLIKYAVNGVVKYMVTTWGKCCKMVSLKFKNIINVFEDDQYYFW